MIKEDVVARVSKRARCSRYLAERVIDETLGVILDALEHGDKVQFLSFGTFDLQHRAARLGRNINTGESVPIPARTVPVFRPGRSMKIAAERSDQK